MSWCLGKIAERLDVHAWRGGLRFRPAVLPISRNFGRAAKARIG